MNLSENEVAIINAANFWFEECAKGEVSLADIYHQTDLSYEEIEQTIADSAWIIASDGSITHCPDSGMMEGF